MLKMNVLLCMVTTRMVEEYQWDKYYQSDNCCQNVGWSPILDDETISNYSDQCSICLIEFLNGSHLELFFTRCSIFSIKSALPKLIYWCTNCPSSCSWPLHRREIKWKEKGLYESGMKNRVQSVGNIKSQIELR